MGFLNIQKEYSGLTGLLKSAPSKKRGAYMPDITLPTRRGTATPSGIGMAPGAARRKRRGGPDSQYVEGYRQRVVKDPSLRLRLGIPDYVANDPNQFAGWVDQGAPDDDEGFGEPGFAEPGGPSLSSLQTPPPGGEEDEPIIPSEFDIDPTQWPDSPDYEGGNRYEMKADEFDGIVRLLNQLANLQAEFLDKLAEVGGAGNRIPVISGQRMEGIDTINYYLEPHGSGARVSGDWNKVLRILIPDAAGDTREVFVRDAIAYFETEAEHLHERGLRLEDMDETEELLWDVWDKWQEGDGLNVEPFGDPEGWSNTIGAIFGELDAMPDTVSFFEEIFELMPMSNYTEASMPGLDSEQRFAKWLDDLKETGWNVGIMQEGNETEFLDWLYEMAESLHPEDFFEFDRSIFDNMRATEVGELMRLINYKESGILSMEEMRGLVGDLMRPIKQGRSKELKAKLAKYGSAGRAYSSVIARSTADMYNDLAAAEMGETAKVLMDSLVLAEKGKLQAIDRLGTMTQDELAATIEIAGLKGTLAGHYLTFMGQIANVAANQYRTRSEAHVAMAALQLKADLGIAHLDLEQYMHEGRLDLDKLRLYAENYWQEKGFNFEVKKQEFADAIMRYQTAADIAHMLSTDQTDRLLKMAALAVEAQNGDRQAWAMYQQMRIEAYAQERGMDIQQSSIIADVMWRQYELQENFDFQRWAIQNQALLQQQLAQLASDTQIAVAKIEAGEGGGFWNTLIKVAGTAAAVIAAIPTGGASAAAVPTIWV